jgi:hypothetical protein
MGGNSIKVWAYRPLVKPVIRDCDMSIMNYPNINRFQVTLSVLLIACRLFSRRQVAVGQDVHREARTSRVWRESQKGINRQISSTRSE